MIIDSVKVVFKLPDSYSPILQLSNGGPGGEDTSMQVRMAKMTTRHHVVHPALCVLVRWPPGIMLSLVSYSGQSVKVWSETPLQGPPVWSETAGPACCRARL